MQWSDVAQTVGKIAPVLGAALAGPAGSAVGSLVATALGVTNSPEALAGATADADQRIKLAQIEQDHRREILSLTLTAQAKAEAEETARLQTTQETMRAELQHEGVYKSGWRPAIGWVMAFSFGAMTAAMAVSVLRDPSQLPDVMDGIITLIVSMGAVLGVNIHSRSKDKRVSMTGEMPATFMDALKKR